MSSKTAISDLHNLFANFVQKAPCQEFTLEYQPNVAARRLPGLKDPCAEQSASRLNEKSKGKQRFNLLSILFPDRELETFRQIEGGGMPSAVIYNKMGDNIVATRWSPPSGR